MFYRMLTAAAALFVAGVLVLGQAPAANLPLITGAQDPSQITATLNALIQSINSGTGGLVNAQTGAVATGTGTGEQVLQTYTLPANYLSAAGQSITTRCWGVTGATANNKTVKLYFGASAITTGAIAANAQAWFLEMIVMRTGAATQAVYAYGQAGTGSVTPVAVFTAAGTDDLTAGVVIKCTGTDGTSAASDITANGMLVLSSK